MPPEIWNRFWANLSWQFIAFLLVAIPLNVYLSRYFGLPRADILGLVAIEFAAIAIWFDFGLHRRAERLLQSAEQSHRRTEQLQQTAEEIASAATTRYLAPWPRNLADLTNLISRTEQSDRVLILVDFFGYAHFSNPEAYKKYLEACKAAIKKGVTLQVLLCGEKQARACHEIQLESKAFPGYLQDPEVTKWLEEYKNILQGYRPEDRESFIDALTYLSDTFCHQLLALQRDPNVKGSVVIRTMSAREEEIEFAWMRHAVYCWIIREREMIFCFPKFYGPKSGDCFQTHDNRLIASYQSQFDEKWKHNAVNEIKDHVYDSKRFREASSKIEQVRAAGASH